MSSTFYGTKYKLQGKWVAEDNEAAEFGGERVSIEVDDTSAPKVSYETAGESYYPQTLRSWHEDQLHWEIDDEVFTLNVVQGPGKLERPYQKYVTIENLETQSFKHYKLVEITEEEYEDHREWYKSVEDKIWCKDSQWESLPTKDRIDNPDVSTLSANENGFIINEASLCRYDESIGGSVVNIPNGIKRIKSGAFRNCEGVKSVYIPDSVKSIGDGCFKGCKNLVSVRLPEGLIQINDNMFSGCESLQEIVLPNAIMSIGRDGFSHCHSLKEFVMPKELKFLGTRAFANTTSLEKVTLNLGLQKIEFAAFWGCTALSEIHIPESVNEISINAFQNCNNLEKITVDEGNEIFHCENNCLINTKNKLLILACNDSVIPSDGSVEGIYSNAFSNCKKVESIVVPEAIKGISQYAFEGCSSLLSVQLPKSLPNGFGDGIFMNCRSLEHVEMPNDIKNISMRMFYGCENLKEIKIPDSVTKIDICAFSGCKTLTELLIPKNVKYIGSYFDLSTNGDFIEGCTSLRKLEVEDGNSVYHSKDNCIIETKTKTLLAILENGVVPNDGSVIKIGENAFGACENTPEISLPEGVEDTDLEFEEDLENSDSDETFVDVRLDDLLF